MKSIRLIIFFSLLYLGLVGNAQHHRFMVFFSDKENSSFSLDRPLEFLSQKSIDRRLKHGIEIVNEDLPVNEEYITVLRSLDVEVFFSTKWLNGVLVQTDSATISSVMELNMVSSALYAANGTALTGEEMTYEIPDIFNEPRESERSTDFQIKLLDADSMHLAGFRGEGINIAVFDGGFRGVNTSSVFAHVYENNRLLDAKDFVTNSSNPFQFHDHGTKVLSTMAANHERYMGVSPNANYMLYVTEEVAHEYRVEEYNWLFAAERADSAGVDIIQSSLGYNTFDDESMDYTYEDLNGSNAVISKAASIAFEKGILVINSAGNQGGTDWKYITPPADGVNTISVGSIDSEFVVSNFSSVGPTFDGRIKPELVALGAGTTVINADGNITSGGGTSYASPLVAGLAAGLWQKNPEWTNTEMRDVLTSTASRAGNPSIDYGFGIPSFGAASGSSLLDIDEIIQSDFVIYPNPLVGDELFMKFSNHQQLSNLTLMVHDLQGREWARQEITGKLPEYSISLPKIGAGTYILTIYTSDFERTVKIIKK